MSAPHIDPERLAALLDGRLDAGQRAELLAQLDQSPEMLQAYADAAAVQQELATEAAAGPATSASTRAARRWYRYPGSWMALAAAIVLAVATPLAWRAGHPGLPAPAELASRVDVATTRLAADEPPWPQLRGAGEPSDPTARAVRIGARLVDLAVLTRASDSAASRVALQLSSMLSGVPAGGPATVAFRSLSDARSVSNDTVRLREAETAAEGVAGRAEVRAGAWLEAARLAAAGRDSAFFDESRTMAALRALESLSGQSATGRSAVARLRDALRARPRDWDRLEQSVVAALRELAA